MKNKIDWKKVDKEFESDVQKIKNADKDIVEYRKRKTTSKHDAEVVNHYLNKNKKRCH